MGGIKITLVHNTAEIGRKIVAAPEFMAEELDRAFGRIGIKLSRAEREAAPKYRSELANSIGYERIGLLQHIVAARGKAYGPYVDQGTGPGGWVPLDEIANWIRRKGITPRKPGVTASGLAHLIRQSIAAKGVRAQNFWGPTFEAMLPDIDVELNAAADRAVARAAQA